MVSIRRLFAVAVLVPLFIGWCGIDLASLLGASGAAPRLAIVLGGTMLGASITCTPAWRALRHVDTLFHELGHAVFAALHGAHVRHILMHRDASGLAAYQLPARGRRIARISIAGVGYLFPAAVALAAAVSLTAGTSIWAIWYLAGVAAGAAILLIRNVWGLAVTLLVALALQLAATRLSADIVDLVLATGIGLLLAGSLRSAVEQLRLDDLRDTDAATIAQLVHLPGRWIAAIHVVACTFLSGVTVWYLAALYA